MFPKICMVNEDNGWDFHVKGPRMGMKRISKRTALHCSMIVPKRDEMRRGATYEGLRFSEQARSFVER